MSTPSIPSAMVEAAERVLDEITGFGTLEGWQVAVKFSDGSRRRDVVAALLAAALGVCEVREQWRATDFDGWSLWLDSREHLTSWVERFGKKNGFACQRRLKITSPAEPDPTAGG